MKSPIPYVGNGRDSFKENLNAKENVQKVFNLYISLMLIFIFPHAGSSSSLLEDIQDSFLRSSIPLWLGDTGAEATEK
jgi:hypothetical protein